MITIPPSMEYISKALIWDDVVIYDNSIAIDFSKISTSSNTVEITWKLEQFCGQLIALQHCGTQKNEIIRIFEDKFPRYTCTIKKADTQLVYHWVFVKDKRD